MFPILIHVGASDKKPTPIITINTILLGTFISIAKYYIV